MPFLYGDLGGIDQQLPPCVFCSQHGVSVIMAIYLQHMVAKIDQNEAKLLNLGKIMQTRRIKRAKLLRRHLMHLPAAHLC
jgi:hypothetical protein